MRSCRSISRNENGPTPFALDGRSNSGIYLHMHTHETSSESAPTTTTTGLNSGTNDAVYHAYPYRSSGVLPSADMTPNGGVAIGATSEALMLCKGTPVHFNCTHGITTFNVECPAEVSGRRISIHESRPMAFSNWCDLKNKGRLPVRDLNGAPIGSTGSTQAGPLPPAP